MNKKILVPLGQNDRTEEMIPYIEKVARPGMKVVFLMRYPVDGIRWRKEEYGIRAAFKAGSGEPLLLGRKPRKSEEAVAPACEALRAKGVEAAVMFTPVA